MRIRGKKLMAIMLSAVLTLSIVPFIGTSSVVQAAEEKKALKEERKQLRQEKKELEEKLSSGSEGQEQ